jgi:hypothetical protein
MVLSYVTVGLNGNENNGPSLAPESHTQSVDTPSFQRTNLGFGTVPDGGCTRGCPHCTSPAGIAWVLTGVVHAPPCKQTLNGYVVTACACATAAKAVRHTTVQTIRANMEPPCNRGLLWHDLR